MRRRPSNHWRNVRTKLGRRLKLVNPWIRKNYGAFGTQTGVDLFDDPEYAKSKGYDVQLKKMSPDQFLKTVQKQDPSTEYASPEEYERRFKFPSSISRSARGIISETKKIDIPYIEMENDKPVAHEGRHRAWAAKQLGKKEIPVAIVKRPNYGQSPLYHGTSEQALARMALSGGLKPQSGKLWLTDSSNYARLKARQAKDGVIIQVDAPKDVRREGRHFITQETIPVRLFRKVDVI